MSQWQLNINSNNKKPEAQENATEEVTVGFNFESDWLKVWFEMNNSTNHAANKKKNQTAFDYFRHLIETSLYVMNRPC